MQKYESRVHPFWEDKNPKVVVFMPENSSEKEWSIAMGRALVKNIPNLHTLSADQMKG